MSGVHVLHSQLIPMYLILCLIQRVEEMTHSSCPRDGASVAKDIAEKSLGGDEIHFLENLELQLRTQTQPKAPHCQRRKERNERNSRKKQNQTKLSDLLTKTEDEEELQTRSEGVFHDSIHIGP